MDMPEKSSGQGDMIPSMGFPSAIRQTASAGTCKSASPSKLLISSASFFSSGLSITPGGGAGHRPLMIILPPLIPAPGSGPTSP